VSHTNYYFDIIPWVVGWKWRIIYFSPNGEGQIEYKKSTEEFHTKNQALSACLDWMDENDFDASRIGT
jgi:hypothetical protein